MSMPNEEDMAAAEVARLRQAKRESEANLARLAEAIRLAWRTARADMLQRQRAEARQHDAEVTIALHAATARLKEIRRSGLTESNRVGLMQAITRAAFRLADDDSDHHWAHLEKLLDTAQNRFPDIFEGMSVRLRRARADTTTAATDTTPPCADSPSRPR